MNKIKLVIIVFIAFTCNFAFASDSLKVILYNQQKKQHLEIYKYKVRNKEYFIASYFVKPYSISTFYYKQDSFTENEIIQFWIHIRHRFFWGGRWVQVINSYQKEKSLKVTYSNQRKRS